MDPEPWETIRSRSNPVWKLVGGILAGKNKHSILLEGDRLIEDALAARRAVDLVLVSEERSERAEELRARGCQVRLVSSKLFRELTALKNSPGILATGKMPENRSLETLKLGARSLLVVAAGISDPGNLGALARSAEAFGAQALVLTRGSTQPWSDKALRGSMGSLLRLPVSHGWDPAELARELGLLGCRQACAATRGGTSPADFDWKGPLALWLGAETGALPTAAARFEPLTIPIAARVESLNVTVAASVLLYAAARAHAAARGGPRGGSRDG